MQIIQRSSFRVAFTLGAVAIAVIGLTSFVPEAASHDASTIERNKATARRWSEELWSRGNLAVADEIIAADYVRHDPGDPFPARGPADVKRIVSMLRSMLPDFNIHVEAIIAEGDMVVSRYTATATDTVGYMGHPATNKAIKTPAIQIFRFKDGMIVESWAARDDLGTLKQLGLWPTPGATR